ncbi:MAG: tetratricopeptide repeat protein [Desulfitobacteriia bacterium]|jgi:tetratricopeptide (TPR) repeat protein
MDIIKEWQNYLEIGIQYLADNELQKAEEYFSLSLAKAEELQVPILVAFTSRLLATTQLRNNKLDEAESGFNKALMFCNRLNNKKGIAEAQAGLAGVFFARKDYLKSIEYYWEALNVYPEGASALRLATLYSDLGQAYGQLKDWKKAEASFLKAKVLCQVHNFLKGEAEIEKYLGEVYFCQGQNKAAEKSLKRAVEIFVKLGDECLLANVLQNIAFLAFEANEVELALQYQYRVVALFLKNKRFLEVSESYYLLSNILQYCKYYLEAERSLKISLDYYEGIDLGFALRFHGLASIALYKKHYEEAKKYYLEALKYFQFDGDGKKIGEICDELIFLLNYEDACLRGNTYQWLIEKYEETRLSEESPAPKFEILLQLANSLNMRGKNLAALRCGWRALEIAKAMDYDTSKPEALIQNISKKIRKLNK